jgi:hypothetical protein
MATSKLIRDFYKILLVGAPGKGKTYSFRKLNKEKTGFVNAENKPLSFEGTFKYHARPKKFAGAIKAIEDYASNSEIEVIVVDSLSAIFDMLIEEMRANFKGYDIWDNYNRSVTRLMNVIKGVQKEVILTAHYEIINIEGEPEKRVKTKGKEWEGMIEREFTVVLYADSKFKDDKPEYFFRLAAEGSSTKCPPGIFGEDVYKVPNDSAHVLSKVVEFARKSEVETADNAELFS